MMMTTTLSELLDNYAFIIILVAVIAFVFYQALTSNKRKREAFLRKIRSEWGKNPKRAYDELRFKSISSFFRNTKGDAFFIDDITWDDLDMDEVFSILNNSMSSSGEDYIYKALRCPCFDTKELEKRDKIAEYFMEHSKEREKIQTFLAELGHTKNISFYDYIERFDELPTLSNFPHYLSIALFVASILSIFLYPPAGIAALIAVLVFNVSTYYSYKRKVENYFVCVGYVVRLVNLCEKFKSSVTGDVFKEMTDELYELSVPLKSITKKSFFIGESTNLSGGLEDIFLDYIKLFTHIDLLLFNTVQKKVHEYIKEIHSIVEIIGSIELCISIASFRKLFPVYCKPTLSDTGKCYIKASDIYHLLIKEPVKNSIDEKSCVLLTGSNASGKSTFLKTLALNIILSQSYYTVLAKAYDAPFFRVYSSMALSDNIIGGESYFIVEIKSLKRILDASKTSGAPVVCFIDEILRGTNTVERIAASSRVLYSLSHENVMCFGATHDIELTQLLDGTYENYNFSEEVTDNDVRFNYKLNKGPATTRNAIKLLKIMEYPQEVVESAKDCADRFIRDGVWKL